MARKSSQNQWIWLAAFAALAVAAAWYFTQPRPQPGLIIDANPPTPIQTVAATAFPSPAASPSGIPLAAAENQFAAPRCGDFKCDASERCDSCAQDCGCAGGEYCNRLNGVCYELEG